MKPVTSTLDAVIFIAIAAGGFAVASVTGSSAILAASVAVLAAGASAALGRAERGDPDRMEPMFWDHIAPIVLFSLGAGLTASESFSRLGTDAPVTLPEWAVVALLGALAAGGIVAMDTIGAQGKRRREALVVLFCLASATALLAGIADSWLGVAISLAMALVAVATAVDLKAALRQVDLEDDGSEA